MWYLHIPTPHTRRTVYVYGNRLLPTLFFILQTKLKSQILRKNIYNNLIIHNMIF